MATKFLISKNKKQFKANMHCHSTYSDGKLSPTELKELYKSQGYNILAITDHCVPKCHSYLDDDDFLTLTGYEAYIRPSETGTYNKFNPEVHLNLFAKEQSNETLICYNKHYTKYIRPEYHDSISRAGSEAPREFTTEYINEFIKTANDNGYMVSYNHPVWSMEEEERILSYQNIFSLEIHNTSSFVANGIENGEALYDAMLRSGMRVGCHSGDDNHNGHPFDSPYNDSCGWYTVFMADKLNYSSIIDSMEKKDFYSSNGPSIYELSVTDKILHMECSPASKVYVFYGSVKHALKDFLPKGQTKDSFDFKIPDDAKFIRVTVYDAEGNSANTRGFFPEEWEA